MHESERSRLTKRLRALGLALELATDAGDEHPGAEDGSRAH